MDWLIKELEKFESGEIIHASRIDPRVLSCLVDMGIVNIKEREYDIKRIKKIKEYINDIKRTY